MPSNAVKACFRSVIVFSFSVVFVSFNMIILFLNFMKL